MSHFQIFERPILPEDLRPHLHLPAAGGYVTFEGWVRNHNEGREVRRLEYEAYSSMATKVGNRILSQTLERFDILGARCIHRVGALEIGDLAVWVGVSAAHRDEAFDACRAIIDTIKIEVPIWKKEHYVDGDSGWVNCERCHDHHAESEEGPR